MTHTRTAVSLHKRHIDPAGEPTATLSALGNQAIVTAWLMGQTTTDPYALIRRVIAAHTTTTTTTTTDGK